MSETAQATWPGVPAPDDSVLPFAVETLGVRGRLVRLGPMVTDILKRHSYPRAVAGLLAEAVALTAMLGTSLKIDGKFILQTKTDGPVDMLVVDFSTPGRMRGYAHFDQDAVAALEASEERVSQDLLMGTGYLAMTIDRGTAADRYQGVVPLDGGTLTDAANTYFAQSEQIPTEVVLCAGQLIEPGGGSGDGWRAGGIVVQHLPQDGAPSPMEIDSGEVPEGMEEFAFEEDDNWTRAKLLVRTAEDHELLDPTLAGERLLYRLYHEDGVRAFTPIDIERHCTCSRERVSDMLQQFDADDLVDMVKDGQIEVTCEFCNAFYSFDPKDVGV
ncbi:MAG: Hsp33 family molecular chaperone [Hyphomicrobiales bacterium]